MNINYQRAMEAALSEEKERPSVFLHVCCAPCASAVLERLAARTKLTLFFYNPNILPREEYDTRLQELKRLLREMPLPEPVPLVEGPYEPERFLSFARALAKEPERGARCQKCIHLRLEETAKKAKEAGSAYFATTLTISPHKDAPFINEEGYTLARTYGIPWLPSDFKKQDGYKRSIELSAVYCLYRQNFCGCPFSQQQRAAP